VRVGPLDLADDALQRHQCSGVILGGKRMMRGQRNGGRNYDSECMQKARSHEANPPRVTVAYKLPRGGPTVNARIKAARRLRLEPPANISIAIAMTGGSNPV